MSLDVYLTATRPSTVFKANITHNLSGMADAAGLYTPLWRPEEIGVQTAAQLIPMLEAGLAVLEAFPERFASMNPANGWGRYEDLVRFVREYLAACREGPDASVRAYR